MIRIATRFDCSGIARLGVLTVCPATRRARERIAARRLSGRQLYALFALCRSDATVFTSHYFSARFNGDIVAISARTLKSLCRDGLAVDCGGRIISSAAGREIVSHMQGEVPR